MTNSSAAPHRWFGVGYSAEEDSAAAGAAAAEQALRHGDAKLVIVFCSDSYDLEALLGAVNERSGGVPLIGCSTAGQISGAGHGDASVVVTALGGDGFSVSTAASMNASQRLREAGAEAAACAADDADREHRLLVLVTRSGGNRVYELDDRPALDVYLDRLDVPQEAREDEEAFNAFAITHPLGLSRRSSEEGVRLVAGADFVERSLAMIAEVPQGGLAWFMQGDNGSVLDATDDACAAALEAIGDNPLAGMIAFDCAARRGVLGDEGIGHEIERVASHAGTAPVAGFYSYGEIARVSGVSGFHNQTLVVLAVT